ncbi:MAG: glycine cleavage system protein GcvH [Candidatus Latescibacteria bacterium]|nr:glycine cleavage system protein GcvH [Candidatus Latescibacterota bacterium]
MSQTQAPEGLHYTDEHEWVDHQDGVCTVGITDYAQAELGDIVFVEMPEVGNSLEKGESFGTVEAVKTVADLYAPVSGEVVAINTALEDDAASVNTDPYGDGWMIKIRLDDPQSLESLLSPQAYEALISEA